MRDRLEPLDDRGQLVVIDQERVAAGKDYLRERVVVSHSGKRLVDPAPRRPACAVRKLAAKTVAAVHRTAASHQQRSAAILVHEPGCREKRRLCDRVDKSNPGRTAAR